MPRMSVSKKLFKNGFTIVEMAIIAPVVVLTIVAFVTLVVSLTGDTVASRSTTQLSYNIQNALSLIESDIKYSSQFIEQNDVTLTSPQGLNNDTTVFDNVTSTYTALILRSSASTDNPLSGPITPVYLSNSPNACGSASVSQNTVMSYNIVYFVSNNTLWRRVLMRSDYGTAGCSVPWQQPSCAIGQTAAFCKSQDVKVLENVSNFGVAYYLSGDSDTALSNASDYNQTDPVRRLDLNDSNTTKISLTASSVAGGRTISSSGSLRVTQLSKDVTYTTPGPPTISSITAGEGQLSVSFAAGNSGTSAITNYEYSTNGGSTWTTRSPAATTSPLVITGLTGGTAYNVRIRAVNSLGYGNQSNQVSATPTAISTMLTTNTYSQSSVYSGNRAATWQYMNNNDARGADAYSNSQTGTNSEAQPWVKTDLGSTLNVTKVIVGYDFSSSLPGGWGPSYTTGSTLQGSNDNATWTNIATLNGSYNASTGLQELTVNQSYRYLRVTRTSNYLALLEFQVWVSNTSPTPTITSFSPSFSLTTGGASVVITGTNFTGASSVSFGGTPASSFTVNSPTQITAISPAKTAGTVSIAVTTANGTATSANTFTYGSSGTAVSYSSIGTGITGSANVTWTHNLAVATSGYLVVYVMVGGTSTATGTATIGGSTNIPQIAPYLTWSDGGVYVFTAFGVATSLSGSQTITVTLSGSPTEVTAQSVFYANVNSSNVSVTTSTANSGAWSSAVVVPTNGYASHAFGSRVPSVNLTGGELLYQAGGTTYRNYLAVQQSQTSTTFTADANGRGWGAIRVILSPN